MRRSKLAIAFLTSLLTLISAADAQQVANERKQPIKASKSAKSSGREILKNELPKLAGSALALNNLQLRVDTLGRLADLWWDVDVDGSRQLFQKTYDLLRAIEPANEQSHLSPNDAAAKLPQGKLISLYVRFFSLVARHDAVWKEQLLKDAPQFLSTPAVARNLDLNTAFLLLNKKNAHAYDFIQAGITTGFSGLTNTMQILDLLRRLRELDAKRADQLFLQLMRQLETQNDVAPDDLLTIGNYIFTGRPPGPAPEERIVVSPVYVGSIGFHADISYDRPDISPETVDRYLRSSAAILSRESQSEATMMQSRAVAFLLMPKARRFAPDLIPILSNLSTGIDPKRTNSVEARSTPPEPVAPTTLESVIETLDATTDPVKREEYCLRMIGFFYSKADFNSASALVARMSSPEVREQLTSLVATGQAIHSLHNGDLDAALLQTRRLSYGKDRGFLWFAIAQRTIQKGDLPGGRIALDSGLADARRADGSIKASLLLLGSELASGIDLDAGSNLLSEALSVTNNFDSDLADPLRFDCFARIRVGLQSVLFSTNISGCQTGTLKGAIRLPATRDPSATMTLILQLKNEHVRSLALLAFVTALTS
jgi:hypothetical protein